MTAQFYQGTNTPTLKSSLSIPGVLPGAIEVFPNSADPASPFVILGANTANAPIVIYAPAPYDSWIEESTGLPTGTAVTSIKAV